METVFQIAVKVLFSTLTVLVAVGLPLLAHFGVVSLLGWSLTRPSIAVWRQELIAPRWQRAAYVFGFSPILALPLAMVALEKWGTALPLFGWIRAVPILGMGLILLIVPALAGCWLALPQYEGERFSRIRAWSAALLFTITDAIGASVAGAVFFS